MTLLKELQYNVLDKEGNVLPNKSIAISVKVDTVTSKYLIHKSLVIQDLNRRQGTASSKTRSEVKGGGKKPWKQKGTGRARSGSSNSPLWKGGGVTFGPKPRTYNKKINSKEKQLALRTTLYNSTHKTKVLDNSFENLETMSTKDVSKIINKITSLDREKRILVVASNPNNNLKLAIRNLPNVQLSYSNSVNLRDLLLSKEILITESALRHFSLQTQ
jgi:large subunit ribosomal protein L4